MEYAGIKWSLFLVVTLHSWLQQFLSAHAPPALNVLAPHGVHHCSSWSYIQGYPCLEVASPAPAASSQVLWGLKRPRMAFQALGTPSKFLWMSEHVPSGFHPKPGINDFWCLESLRRPSKGWAGPQGGLQSIRWYYWCLNECRRGSTMGMWMAMQHCPQAQHLVHLSPLHTCRYTTGGHCSTLSKFQHPAEWQFWAKTLSNPATFPWHPKV